MLILGWLLIILGVIGVFLPFLQGFILLALGGLILSKNSPWWNEKMEALKSKHPGFKKTMDKIDSWLGEKKEQAEQPPETASEPKEPSQGA